MTENLCPEDESLFDLFSSTAKTHAEKIAILEDTGLTRLTLTYNELWNASCNVSKALGDILGTSGNNNIRSQYIAVCTEQNLLFPALILGILFQRQTFVCVDPTWPDDKQRKFLEKLNCVWVIRSEYQTSLWEDHQCVRLYIAGHAIYLDNIKPSNYECKCSHSIAYAIQTSGSTGEPKTIRVRNSSIVPNIQHLRQILNVSSKDIVFLASPSTFDPSVVEIFIALTSGATLLITSKSVKASPAELLKVLFPPGNNATNGVSVLQMTPSVFSRWSESDIQNIILGATSSLRVLLLGGEPCYYLQTLMEWKANGNNTEVYTIYGITEVSAWASIHHVPNLPPKTDYTQPSSKECKALSLELGEALSDTLFKVCDLETGSVVSDGDGELFIGSLTRICEIDNETCLDLVAPVYRCSGDIVKVLNGSYYYMGRKDHMIKRWGQRVSLHSVEKVAMDHKLVSAACCVWDEIQHSLSLFIVAAEQTNPNILRRHFFHLCGTEPALIPDEICIVESLPVNHHGKVMRSALLKLKKETSTQRRDYWKAGFSSRATQEFANLWYNILGLEDLQQTKAETSFLSLGGNSLLAIHFATCLEDRLGSVPDHFVSYVLSGNTFELCLQMISEFYGTSKMKISSNYEGADCSESIQCRSEAPHRTAVTDTQTAHTSLVNRLLSNSSRGKNSARLCQSLKTKDEISESRKINILWKIDLGKCIDASPLCLLYESGLVCIVIGSHSGKLVAIDGTDGSIQWTISLPDRIESTACSSVCGQLVYVGCYDGKLYCIHVISGEILWHFQTAGMIKCSPVLCNNGKSVMFGSYDHKMYCVRAKTGQLEWISRVTSQYGSWLASPLVMADVALVCSLACEVAAVGTANGQGKWFKTLQSPIFSTPAALPQPFESYVVVAEVQGKLHCFSIVSGVEIWQWDSHSHIFSSLTCVSTSGEELACLILYGCHDGFVYCLAVNTELKVSLYWKVSINSPVTSTPFPFQITPTAEQCYVATASSSGQIFVLNLRNGIIIAQCQLPSEVYSSPVVWKTNIFVGCRDNYMYCLRLQSDSL